MKRTETPNKASVSAMSRRMSGLVSGRRLAMVVLFGIIAAVCLAMPALAEDVAEEIASTSRYYNTFLALVPSFVAIILALITKEVYSSLFIGIVVGGALAANGNFEHTIKNVFTNGIVASVSDPYNVGILVFLIMLGSIVSMMNKAGGSAAFGRWAESHIKTRIGAQLATVVLGCLIFIDDYFNCLTVGSVMRPVTDSHKISRAKLAYLIDATAAPVCIIAPISSWAAAVSGFVEDGSGLALFIRTIPYNLYALLTLTMMLTLTLKNVDYGPMAKFEKNAKAGDIFSGINPYANAEDEAGSANGRVIDLILPIVVLVVCCVIGMIYTGGFFGGANFVEAFSNSDASVGLMLGSAFGLFFAIIYYVTRKSFTFKEAMGCVPEGFKAMVPAIMILVFAWSLKNMTSFLGADVFVAGMIEGSAKGLQMFLPAVIFLIGCVLSFATGTSWGTFGILIPIVLEAFPWSEGNPISIVCVAACMAGAVCGDHCSPISDTTIMSSAGAQCEHVNHVSTQLPYALTCAAVSTVGYLIAGVLAVNNIPAVTALPFSILLMIIVAMALGKKTDDESESTQNAV